MSEPQANPPAKSSSAGGAPLRTLGLAAGGGAMAVALIAAMLGQSRDAGAPAQAAAPPIAAPAPPLEAPTLAPGPVEAAGIAATPPALSGPAPSGPAPSGPPPKAKPTPSAGRAVTPADPGVQPNLEFIVKFRDGHPMARAAQLSAANREAEAAALARQTLRSRLDLAGLCLQGFTMGGAEVVLRLCEPVEDRKVESAARQWLRHLKAARGVQYVDRNVVLQPEALGAAPK